MVDHNSRLSSRSPTRRTRRSQLPVANLANERHIALRVTEIGDLLEQCRRPDMWILGQPLAHIRLDHIERVRSRSPLPRDLLTRKVSSHCFSVSSQMAGNSRYRPSPPLQRVYSPRIPPVPTSAVGLPLLAAGSRSQQLGEDPTQRLVFAVTGRGISVIESGEFQ